MTIRYVLPAGALVLSIFFALSSGSVAIPFMDVIQSLFVCPFSAPCGVSELSDQILWEIRLPRVLMALVTGAGLAVTGAVLQSIMRNPLADPYLFGISSGASLGAVIVLSSTMAVAGVSLTLGALLGGLFSVVLMLTLAGRSATNVERLLLSGVAVSFMLSSFTGLILYYSDPDTAASLLFWMMGSFSNSQWSELPVPAIALVVGVFLFVSFRRWFSAVLAGDESAFALGVPVNRFRLSMLLVCAAITAVIVAHVGGIGFVGLMIPHISRYLVGARIQDLVPMCLLIGGIFMIWVDVVAHSLLAYQVLPVGIVTSAAGSLFFFFILKFRTYSSG
ncbi:MAG: ABC transporter permease [Gammaproteobacteria bacterium]|nr:MAG: ABC transporter permease [Pseudomonadota bacterium]PIE38778.1 MAG: ABC transporter permease [Gammaproteobacteria bacterium]